MIRCKECDGTGYVEDLIVTGGPNGPVESLEDIICELCDGEGQIEQEIEEENK